MLREVPRDFLHLLIFLDFGCAAVLLVLGFHTAFFRAGEYSDRRGRLFSLRRPLPSEFSKQYYTSYRQSAWLALALVVALATGVLLIWLDMLIFER